MMTTMEEQLYSFCQFPSSKNHWEEKSFLKILMDDICKQVPSLCIFTFTPPQDALGVAEV